MQQRRHSQNIIIMASVVTHATMEAPLEYHAICCLCTSCHVSRHQTERQLQNCLAAPAKSLALWIYTFRKLLLRHGFREETFAATLTTWCWAYSTPEHTAAARQSCHNRQYCSPYHHHSRSLPSSEAAVMHAFKSYLTSECPPLPQRPRLPFFCPYH